MNTTKNLNLKKPEGSDIYNVNDFNENMDVVDEEIAVLKTKAINNNLLINSNFANPVNQRAVYGVAAGRGGYTFDRWKASNISLSLNDGYVTATTAAAGDGSLLKILQSVEFPEKYSGKTLTASVRYRICADGEAGATVTANLIIEVDGVSTNQAVLSCDGEWHTAEISANVEKISSALRWMLTAEGVCTVDLAWAKLEEGTCATPYAARNYGEEWLLCQRYYRLLNLRDAVLWNHMTDYLCYVKDVVPSMRIKPTVTFPDNVCIQVNGEDVPGFTFEDTSSEYRTLFFRAYKTTHDLLVTDLPNVTNLALLDAEI